jgi:uncharacterized protein (DUF697 family)
MSTMATTPAPQAKAVANGWVALVGFSFLAFLLGAAVQIGLMMLMDALYGACVQSMGPCPQGSEYTLWQELVVTVPTYLIWITPAFIAARKGRRLAAAGVPGGRGLMVAGVLLIALITLAGALMWWIPGI